MRERICVCYKCKKIFALLEKSNRTSCPGCGSEIKVTGIDVEEWQQMSSEERHRVVDKAYNQGIEKRKIYKNLYEETDLASERKVKKSKYKSTLISISTIVAVCLLISIFILIIRIRLHGNPNKTGNDYALEESTDAIASTIGKDTARSEVKKESSVKKNIKEKNQSTNDGDKEANNGNSDIVLYDYVLNESNGDDIVDTIVDDFNGDGIQDMIAEAGKPIDDEWLRYFIFTDGKDTYRFGEYSNSVFYDSESYVLSVGNEKHFVNTSRWRAAALGGAMSHSAIYKIGSGIANALLDKEYAEITGVDSNRGIAYISYHEEAMPGGMEENRGLIYDTGNGLKYFYTSQGITNDYKSAGVNPDSNPESVWRGEKVQEITGNYGIHFYVPADWEIYVEDAGNMDGMDYSAIDSIGHSGWIISTSCYSYEGTIAPFDWGEGQYVYEIGNKGKEHFFICVAAGDEYEEPQYNPDVYFPELEKYREMIGNTAWVE